MFFTIGFSFMNRKSKKKHQTSLEGRLKEIVDARASRKLTNKDEKSIPGLHAYREF
jgi:hypothetical protein